FACKENRLQAGQVVISDQFTGGILAFDGADGRGSGEEALDLVVAYHPPDGSSVGRAYGLTLEDDSGCARDQGRIADIAVSDDPTDIRSGPEHVARIDAVDIPHRPVQRHEMPGSMAHDTLWLAGRARGIEDIGRVV